MAGRRRQNRRPWRRPLLLALTWCLALAAHLLPPWPDIDNLDDLASFLARPHPAPGPGWRSHLLARQLVGGWAQAHQAARQ